MNHLKQRMLLCMLTIAMAIPLFTVMKAEAMAPNCGSWSVVSSPNGGTSSSVLNGVATVSANDVWTVGYFYPLPGNVPARTLTEHWNGSNWSVINSPNVGTNPSLLYATAASSTNDVWAVGLSYNPGNPSQTLIEHWNGKKWKVVSSPNAGSGSNSLYGVAASSPRDVWAVGYYNNNGSIQTLIEHWNGRKWAVISSPNSGAGSTLSGVTAISKKDAWAVGEYSNGGVEQTLTEQWNGKIWQIVASPNSGQSGNSLAGVAAASSTDVWAVGFFSASTRQTLFEHWNGTQWSVVSSPNVPASDNVLAGVSVISSTNVWAVGTFSAQGGGFNQTLTEQWNGTSWSIVPSPNVGPGNSSLNGVATIPANSQIWAVGSHDSNSGVPQTLTEFFC